MECDSKTLSRGWNIQRNDAKGFNSCAVYFRTTVKYFYFLSNDILSERDHPPRSWTNLSMVRITEVPIFLIVFELLFQMQGKSRQSISKKGRNALVDLIWQFSEIGCYDLFCLSIDEILLASERAGQILSKKLVPRFQFWPLKFFYSA